jgi:hypothetical protein
MADTPFGIPIQIHPNPRMGILMNLGGNQKMNARSDMNQKTEFP